MDVAGNDDANDSMLSFVHIVKDNETKEQKVSNEENYDSESDRANDRGIKEQNGDLESESSDEEFEFE